MKITKEGESPDAIYSGACRRCGCEFECSFWETKSVWGDQRHYIERCPHCDAFGYIQVYKKHSFKGVPQ